MYPASIVYYNTNFHDLRHAYVTHHLASVASPADLAAQVGHASVSFMVRAYAHSIPNRREALAKLTDEIMGVRPEVVETVSETKKA